MCVAGNTDSDGSSEGCDDTERDADVSDPDGEASPSISPPITAPSSAKMMPAQSHAKRKPASADSTRPSKQRKTAVATAPVPSTSDDFFVSSLRDIAPGSQVRIADSREMHGNALRV